MSDKIYKIKGGTKEFSDYFKILDVAKVKAENENQEVTVCQKKPNSMDPVVNVYPDGREEKIEN